MRRLPPLALAAILLAPGLARADTAVSTTVSTTAAPAVSATAGRAVSATGGWFRYLLPQIPAGGFVTIDNRGATAAILTGASTSACGMAMLHKSVHTGGVDRMIHLKSVTIPAHGRFRFAPGAYHIMCMKPKMQVGATVDVTLTFRDAPPLTVPFRVYGADGKPAAS